MTSEPRDRVDIEGLNQTPHSDGSQNLGPRQKFLSILFRCCKAYGRLYVNKAGTHYEGRCPRCGIRTSARIGPGGSDKRVFETS